MDWGWEIIGKAGRANARQADLTYHQSLRHAKRLVDCIFSFFCEFHKSGQYVHAPEV
ncbi:MAG: hypothetical protein KGI64_07650 [Xanthomonadaceae bacterium]|nr:hypothetical protein [Xanthomonadaceae bacterium]